MNEINKKVISEILQNNYGVIPEIMVRIRRKSDRQVWKITDANKNIYALKYLEKSARAPIIAAVNDYMHGKGIPVTPVLPTLDGTSYLDVNNGCFLLFPWLEGEHPSYAEPGMIEKMAILLAKFHEASHGYAASGNPITDNRLDWNKIYKKKIKKMEKFRVKASVSEDSFSKVYLNHLPWLKARANWVLEQLPQTALRNLLYSLQHNPRLGHGDYSHLNVLRNNHNELTVIDLDTVSLALPMRDISHLCTLIKQSFGEWSRERFQVVLDAYQQIRPLSAEELELLLLDQIFPHKAIRLAQKYFDDTSHAKGHATLLIEFERCIAIDKQKITELGMGPLWKE
ncbi:MAG: CotS family spore coat protein [Bacillota bacterium]